MANDVEVGETDAAKANPATVPSFTGTLADGVHVLGGMGNALTVETSGGIVQMDTGPAGRRVEKMLESLASAFWRSARENSAGIRSRRIL